MARPRSKSRAVATLPAWVKPLAVPLVISAAIHAAVVVTFVTMDILPGEGGPIAAHISDDVSTSIQLAPASLPAPNQEPEAPPAPPEPVAEVSPPAPEPEKVIEVAEQSAFESAPMPVTPPAPAEPVVQEAHPKPPPVATTPVVVAKTDSPVAGFAGVQVRKARRIVYAVDVSGSMAACLDSVLLELRRSIGKLEPEQQFQIVFFRQELNGEQRAVAIDEGGGRASLLGASPENKRRVDQLLRSARPMGRSAPLVGLRRSLEFAPDVVFLLTSNIQRSDQGAASDARMLKSLDDLNPISRVSGRRPVVIKTLQFVEDDPTGLMQSIAATHGDGPGSYVQLKVSDIERPDR